MEEYFVDLVTTKQKHHYVYFLKKMLNKLFPFQNQAIERLKKSLGCQLLHIGCGGGKTLTTLTFLTDKNLKRVLVIAPASLLSIWNDESEKWFGFSFIKIKGNPAQRKRIYNKRADGFYVIGYETFLRDWKYLQDFNFEAIVAEESHRMKSPVAKVTKAILKFSRGIPIRIALTGTAMPSGWKDIWSQVNFVHPGALYGNFYTFRNIHCIMPIPNCPAITGYREVEKIKEEIKPYVFTVPKDEIDKALPAVTYQEIKFDLSTKERKVYQQIKDELVFELKGEETTIANALGAILRLRQVVNGLFVFGQDEPSSKIQVLKDLLDSIEDDEKIIVFTMFAETAKEIQKQLNIEHIISGETVDKDSVVSSWKKEGRVLIGTKSLSEGWNCQEARIIVNFDLPYTNAEYTQRISRCLRSGQKRPVLVYDLIAENSIDAHVKKILEKKKSMTDDFVQWTRFDIDSILL